MERVVETAGRSGIPRLFAEVSITARPFFRRHGFLVVREQEALRRNPHMGLSRKWLAATLGLVGRTEEAAWEAEELRMLIPGFNISDEAQTMPFQDQDLKRRYLEGLRLAGLPESD